MESDSEMRKEDNDQVRFWRGDFGNDYVGRNESLPERIQTLTRFWSKAFWRWGPTSATICAP